MSKRRNEDAQYRWHEEGVERWVVVEMPPYIGAEHLQRGVERC